MQRSVETPPLDFELSDEQSMDLLASPLFPHKREASADRSQVYHSQIEKIWCPSRPDLKAARRDPSLHGKLNLKDISDRFLKNRDNSFSQGAHREILKRDCRAEQADAVIRELQRQIQSTRMEFCPHLRGVTKRTSFTIRRTVYKNKLQEKTD